MLILSARHTILVRSRLVGRPVNNGQLGQGLIEYAILACLISIAAVALITNIGSYLPHLFAVPLNAL